MENEEPTVTEAANEQIAVGGHKLPEQSRVPSCPIPRPFSFEHLIHQWQPMGFRVTLNLPFTGNDQDYLFAIRNGPFIPLFQKVYTDTSSYTNSETSDDWPDLNTRDLSRVDTYTSYAFNNMRPVMHAGKQYDLVKPDTEEAVYISQFDQPPILASLATMFRKWRGTMHYRIRVVSGFTTQGYIFASLIRNSPAAIGVYPTQEYTPGIFREDSSYREAMINSYVLGDTAMFRHFEVEVPFEYPVPYYDQFNWIGNRSRPAHNFGTFLHLQSELRSVPIRALRNEPHGDNYIVFGVRGRLESGIDKSQIAFELEYRAGDDFQFSDPFLPYNENYLTSRDSAMINKDVAIIQVPADTYETDGLHAFKKKSAPSVKNIPNRRPPVYNRKPRDVGEDTVDPPLTLQEQLKNLRLGDNATS